MGRPKRSSNKSKAVSHETVKQEPTKQEIVTPSEKIERGVLLLALGHPMYTHYSGNMAISLKAAEPSVHITLCYEGAGYELLDDSIKANFDKVIYCPSDYYIDEGRTNYFKAKLFLDKISPYQKTLYLDVDQIWNPRRLPSDLFSIYDGCTFQPIVLGSFNTEGRNGIDGDWMDYDQLLNAFGLESVYDISSEVLYFENTSVFENAIKIYNEGTINVKTFGGGYPDEPFLMAGLALSKENLKYKAEFCPSYWQGRFFTRMMKDEDVYNNYFLISAGGNHNAINTIRMYNNIAGSNFDKLGIGRKPYNLQHKRSVLKTERQKL